MNIRTAAVRVLLGVFQHQQSLTTAPNSADNLSPKDEALLQALCYGVCRWQPRLDLICRQLLDRPLKTKDIDIRVLLLVGIYQLLFTRIPAHAAINETVKASGDLGKSWARGLINAVLRRLQREQQRLLTNLEPRPEYRYSHPDWLLARLKEAWPDHWETICAANNTQAPLTLRINRLQTNRSDYRGLLNTADIKTSCCRWSSDGLQLDQPCALDRLPNFQQGAVSVQDEAAQLAPGLLQLEPGQRVLDACAAPGGKTCHLLETEPGLQELVALELEPQRMEKVEENLKRLRLQAHLVIGDAATPQVWWDKQPFDRILLDAPCSATGVIRRHPDIKLLRRNSDIDKLAVRQLKLLAALWPLLRPGGRLLYATCSILPQENEQVIGRFLGQTPDAHEIKFDAEWGIPGEFGRYLLPAEAGHDGFYYAKLAKRPRS